MLTVNRPILPRFVRRTHRRLWRHLLPQPKGVVYHEGYGIALPTMPADHLRAERILAFLAAEGLVTRRTVHQPHIASMATVNRAHDDDYLDSLNDPATLGRIMGAELTHDQTDRLLDAERLHTGGTILAARLALQRHTTMLNLGGGFHHAGPDYGGGFCIFNDVAIAIEDARATGFDGRVLVIDLDVHDGDGTRAIFARDDKVHTFSIHAAPWDDRAHDAVADTSIALGSDVDDDTYLGALHRSLPAIVAAVRPRLTFYLAGCDPAHDDLLGNWRISDQGMLARDRFVMETLRSERKHSSVVIVLAGGYGPQAWRYTSRFAAELFLGKVVEPPSTEEITLERYRYIASLIDPAELSGRDDDAFAITEDDLMLPGWGNQREHRLLSFYTKHGIELVLERSGIFDRLRDLGYFHPTLELDLSDPTDQTVRVWDAEDRRDVLVELRLRRDRRTLPDMELLRIEWLLMQNPRAAFTDRRRKLPGQTYPGLGMAADMVALLTVACERLHLDGLVFVPSQFHIAAPWHIHQLVFVEPEAEVRFATLSEFFANVPLATASHAIAAGEVIDRTTGEPYRWQPAPMVFPVSERLESWLEESRESTDTMPTPDLYWQRGS
ncbi:MAG: histone deacetylase [Acidobacteriota bacterium]